MQIKLKLMGMLKPKEPPDRVLEIADGASIETVLNELEIPVESVAVFTVNGRLVRDRRHLLAAGDELSILPPVGGG